MSTDAHVIRLRGPWNYEVLGESATRPAGIFDFGGDWHELQALPASDRLRLTRRFGCPGHLDHDEHVILVVEGRGLAESKLLLNGQELMVRSPAAGAWRCEITAHLLPRNELVLEIAAGAAPPPWSRPIDDVRLEIDF